MATLPQASQLTAGRNHGDSIVLTNATTADFTTGTLTGIEVLSGSVGLIDQLTMSASQWAGFTTINLGAGSQNALNVVANGDISALGTPTVSNVTIGNLTGTGGTDLLRLPVHNLTPSSRAQALVLISVPALAIRSI